MAQPKESYRRSNTGGQYTTKKYAESHPRTTEKETQKVQPKKK